MTKLEERIRSGLHEAAERVPEPSSSDSPQGVVFARPNPAKKPLHPGLVVPVVVAVVFLLAAPLVWLRITGAGTPDGSIPVLDQPEAQPDSTMTPTTSAQDATDLGAVPEFEVTEIDDSNVGPSTQPDDSTSVDEILESTGKTYDPLPDHVPDAAIFNDRVVIVGGNEGQSVGIWYSDGEEWIPAEIVLPAGVSFGGEVGDYRLADGIQNVEAVPNGRLIAWEPIQVVGTFENEDRGTFTEPMTGGTIVLSSEDGATWQAQVIDQIITAIDTFDTGVLAAAVNYQEDGRSAASAFWSTDLSTWTKVAELGEGEPREVESDDEGVIITLTVWEVTTNEDGTISYGPGVSTRQVRLTKR